MKIKSIKKENKLAGKKVLLRLDLNVPIKNKKVENDYKIRTSLPTLEMLIKKQASIIIITHLGKPKGKYNEEFSVKPVATALKKILGKNVKYVSDVGGKESKDVCKKLKPGQVAILENLRFKKGELEDKADFAKSLASLADIYVNDALAVSHRKQASVSAIKKYLPSYAGLLLEKELNAFEKILKPKKPLVTIMGGAKIDTKAPLIGKLYSTSNKILLGGGLANSFFKFNKKEIGKSLYSEDSISVIKKILKGRKNSRKIVLPKDVIVESRNGKIKAKKIDKVLKTDTIFDIGPETIKDYADHIKKAQTLIWNGPMGKFEDKNFKGGTMAIARLVASRSSGRAYGVVGGGETVSALQSSGMMEYVDWVSTAGGAMLSYLALEDMPGLKSIVS